MKKIIFIWLLVISCNLIVSPILIAQTSYQSGFIFDTSLVSADLKYEYLMQHHPMLQSLTDTESGMPIKRQTTNNTGAFVIAVVLLFGFALLKNIFYKHVQNLWTVFTSIQISKRQVKEQLDINTRASLLFQAMFFGCSSYILFLWIQSTVGVKDGIVKWIFCFLGIAGFYIIKNMIQHLLAWCFDQIQIYKQYQFTVRIIDEFVGIILFPISIMLLLMEGRLHQVIFMLALLVILGFQLFKYIRLSSMIKKIMSTHFLHFFIYLCAFEILPVWVLWKTITA